MVHQSEKAKMLTGELRRATRGWNWPDPDRQRRVGRRRRDHSAGSDISDGSVIGAGSVVPRDVPPGRVAAGNPARITRSLG